MTALAVFEQLRRGGADFAASSEVGEPEPVEVDLGGHHEVLDANAAAMDVLEARIDAIVATLLPWT